MACERRLVNRRYIDRLRRRLYRARRDRCLACWVRRSLARLEWAHRRPTGLNGWGRGRLDRLMDVKRHPRAYALLCKDCHKLFDTDVLHAPSKGQGWRCDLLAPTELRRILRYADADVGYSIGSSPDVS
jgi:hypothetical protein